MQRAALVPAPSATSAPAVTTRRALDFDPPLLRYVVLASRSRFEIYASDVITGEHKASFSRWRATIETRPTPKIFMDVDLESLQLDIPAAESTVKYRLLEIDKYPRGLFDATIARTDNPAPEHAIEGLLELHGVKRHLRVVGSLVPEGDGFRFKTTFKISRLLFEIRYGGPLERFISDDVRIEVDALAKPERVEVEEAN